jgi:hypothetical protein
LEGLGRGGRRYLQGSVTLRACDAHDVNSLTLPGNWNRARYRLSAAHGWLPPVGENAETRARPVIPVETGCLPSAIIHAPASTPCALTQARPRTCSPETFQYFTMIIPTCLAGFCPQAAAPAQTIDCDAQEAARHWTGPSRTPASTRKTTGRCTPSGHVLASTYGTVRIFRKPPHSGDPP